MDRTAIREKLTPGLSVGLIAYDVSKASSHSS